MLLRSGGAQRGVLCGIAGGKRVIRRIGNGTVKAARVQQRRVAEVALDDGKAPAERVLRGVFTRERGSVRLALHAGDAERRVRCQQQERERSAAAAEVADMGIFRGRGKIGEHHRVGAGTELCAAPGEHDTVRKLFSHNDWKRTNDLCIAQVVCDVRAYSSTIASFGHSAAQVPQSTH